MPSAVIPSVHSYAALPLARQQLHQRYVHPGPLVLGTNPLKTPTPTADRDRTVSRRSEPSSRTTLIGEQPNPWDLLQPQDVMSRHRGAKRPRRYGLLGVISLLSPAYLLSVERWPTHAGPPDHYDRLSSLLEMSLSQSSGLMPLHATSDSDRSEPTFVPSVTLWEATAPVKLPAMRGPGARSGRARLDHHFVKGGISRTAPSRLAPELQSLPPILPMPTRRPAQSYSKGARGLSV